MRIMATILIVLTLLGASYASVASAEPMTEVVLLGHSDLLAQNVPAPRRITRIERFIQPGTATMSDPALAALDDQLAPLLEAIPRSQPVLEYLVVPPQQGATRRSLVGSLSTAGSFAVEELPKSMFSTPLRPKEVTSTTVGIVLFLMTALALRRWILAAVSRVVLWLVVAVNHRGATIVSAPRRKRRRRSSSQHRGADVSWYFRAAGESSHSRGRSRRRWSSAGRPREYVVTDVVYAAAPVQRAPRYLLTNSVN